MEVNKIIGRDFVVGFFVPAVVMVAGFAGTLYSFGILPLWLRIDPADPLKDSTFLALITTVAAFFLMAGNRIIFRTLEGYWVFNLGSRLNHFQRWRFRWLKRRIRKLEAEFEECLENEKEFTKQKQQNKLMRMAVQRYPSTEAQLMFTSFGNAVRAFEDYPRVVYGFESINGWSRLNAVIPKSYQDILGNKRAMTDFWVNVWFVSLLIVAQYVVVAVRVHHGLAYRWIPAAGIALALFAALEARTAAEQWGEWVKAGFDIYLPALRAKWGFIRPQTMTAERRLWKTLSQAIVYRDAPSLDKLEDLREPPSQSEEDQKNVGKEEEPETAED